MRAEIDIDDKTREAVKQYADKNGYRMSRAYGQLIRDALHERIEVDFSWGDESEFMIAKVCEGHTILIPIRPGPYQDETYVISAEHEDELLNAGIEPQKENRDAKRGLTQDG